MTSPALSHVGLESSPQTRKAFVGGTERAANPVQTVRAARAMAPRVGITRVADITGLDTIGLPVFAVVRPNSRSVSVAQGKGATTIEAEASGLMEAIEAYHAEHTQVPLLLQSHAELARSFPVVSVAGLAQVSGGCFHREHPLLWAQGEDLLGDATVMVPYECVHTDFRLPLPSGSGSFLMSSNGLASGNALIEATLHGLYELIERDGNTLWSLAGPSHQARQRVDPASVTDQRCRAVLDLFENAGMDVGIWETTSDIGVAAFVCTLIERDAFKPRRMPPTHGAGCHLRRSIALLRALTEAAQSRLTIISGARDDLDSTRGYADHSVVAQNGRQQLSTSPANAGRAFNDAPDTAYDTFEQDLAFVRGRLEACALRQVVRVDLTRPELGVPVVKMIVPYLEGMSAVPGYLPGPRGRRAMADRQA